MTHEEFTTLLINASASAVDFARRFVENDLAEEVRYRVLLNQSCDDHAKADEQVYPEDDGREFQSLTAEGVADVLWRKGRCPEWIDVAVEAQADAHTQICLRCCGRFTDDERRLNYSRQGTGPFGIKSPNLPPEYVEGTKFRIPKAYPIAAPDRGGPSV
jgi:hypothetical protein